MSLKWKNYLNGNRFISLGKYVSEKLDCETRFIFLPKGYFKMQVSALG